ncbi:MAG: hypothetical protein H0V86_12170 [Chloroflexia bacterium]|nr:hypothetical protein [Chloroflexia bacterium]
MPRERPLLGAAENLLARGPMPEEALARALYGATGSVAPWVKLLRSLLQASDRVRQRTDGQWELVRLESVSPLMVVGRKTRARNGRLLALAIAPSNEPFAGQQWRFETISRSAQYVALDDPARHDEPAMPFSDVAEAVSTLFRDRVIWVLDADLPAVLTTEFAAANLPLPWVEVLVCGHDLWTTSGRKRSMEAVRSSLGLAPIAGDPLRGELEVIAHIASQGSADRSSVSAYQCEHVFDLRRAAAAMPEGPGIYRFREASGAVLYIGSAANLRRRALSYFSEQITLTRGLHGLLDRTRTLDCIPVGTHLEAVVEEARLIAALEPSYNVQRRVFERKAWLRIGAEPLMNVVQVASAPRADRALYLGPLPNRTSVNAVANAIAALWGFSRRGGSAHVSEESLSRLDTIRTLLEQPEGFCAELRLRLHAAGHGLSGRARAALAEHVARTESAVLAEELLPMDPDLQSVLVARLDAVKGELCLLLVRDLVCRVSVKTEAHGEDTLRDTIDKLLSVPVVPDEGSSAERAIVSRWIHAHREDAWVLPTHLGAREIAARLTYVLHRQLEADACPQVPDGEEWWV